MKIAKNLGRTCRYGIRQEIEKGQTDRKDNNCYRTGQTGTGQGQERIWYDDSGGTKRGEQKQKTKQRKRDTKQLNVCLKDMNPLRKMDGSILDIVVERKT